MGQQLRGEALRVREEGAIVDLPPSIDERDAAGIRAGDGCDLGRQRLHFSIPLFQADSFRLTNSSTEWIESNVAGVISSGVTEIW